jgi:hypothetical protein
MRLGRLLSGGRCTIDFDHVKVHFDRDPIPNPPFPEAVGP